MPSLALDLKLVAIDVFLCEKIIAYGFHFGGQISIAPNAVEDIYSLFYKNSRAYKLILRIHC